MTSDEAKSLLGTLSKQIEAIMEIARTANRNNKSVGGDGPYAKRFRDASIAMTATETKLKPAFEQLPGLKEYVEQLQAELKNIKDPTVRVSATTRSNAEGEPLHLIAGFILPAVESMHASPIPATEQ